MTKKKQKVQELVYEKHDPVARWNACQILSSQLYKSEIATSELVRLADETPTLKELKAEKRRIAKN